MRSITTEIYEELNKNSKGIKVNRTDVLQNLIDALFLFNNDLTEASFDDTKKVILEEIKKSYTHEGKL